MQLHPTLHSIDRNSALNLGQCREEGMPLKTGMPVTAGMLATTCTSTSATFRMPGTAAKEDKQGRSIITYAINHISNSRDATPVVSATAAAMPGEVGTSEKEKRCQQLTLAEIHVGSLQ
jgi:hypothetical protein